ncbi:MAG: DEAD/DEAH box helicase [Planctomycetota bacterium]
MSSLTTLFPSDSDQPASAARPGELQTPVLVKLWRDAEAWRSRSHNRQPAKPRRHADAVYEWVASHVAAGRCSVQRYLRLADRVLACETECTELHIEALYERLAEQRAVFRRGSVTAEQRVEALALIRETARRTLGLNAYRVQVAAAAALLDGRMTEMATGEGKTLVAALAACLIGWHGRGCHVITVNDYLAKRDAQWAKPLFEAAGLRVAYITGGTPPQDRPGAYAADITYTTHKEAAADHLRDRLSEQAQTDRASMPLASVLARNLTGEATGSQGRFFRGEAAIIDEADSILLDESTTPLIISGPKADSATRGDGREFTYRDATALAAQLQPNRDFRLDRRHRDLRLTPGGRQQIKRLAGPIHDASRGPVRRLEERVYQALVAQHLYLRDDQYVVQDGKVVIVDESTGRLMPDRTWQAGLHQAIEAKENLEVSDLNHTLAAISFQRFFRLYPRLSGMTGTAWSERAELWRTYRMQTVRIPTHRRCIRRTCAVRPLPTLDDKWDAVTRLTQELHRTGRPVLIGTRSVDDSQALSERLTHAGIPHDVLNAHRHEQEAAIVAEAGQLGRVTVATNMAGRGTDIKLVHGVAERGGLAVIATDRHESRRVDRQLQGRSARQGEPGSATVLTSLDDPLLIKFTPIRRKLLKALPARLPRWLLGWLFTAAQRRAGRLAAHQRRQVLVRDEHHANQLSY